jgi:hypothetical protein
MNNLRDVPLRDRFAALVFGGTSLFLFGVVFALVKREYRVAASPAWEAWMVAALIITVAAAGAFFALGARAALIDPRLRLGSWFRRKMFVADAAELMVLQLVTEGSMWGGFALIPLGGRYSIMGFALLFCSGLIVFLVLRYVKSPEDTDDEPRANGLIGKRHERGSYDDREWGGRE